MAASSLEIIACPPELRREAIALVLREVDTGQRGAIAGPLLDSVGADSLGSDTLCVARRGGQLRGAVWGQIQPGNTALLWPPQLVSGEERAVENRLMKLVTAAIDAAGVSMTQVLLPSRNAESIPLLEDAGFHHLTDLMYLTCESPRFPSQQPNQSELQFIPYAATERDRLMRLIERTYEDGRDCAELNGRRSMEDVIDGYQQTGRFCPENWRIVRHGDEDVGVLLLTEHPGPRHWELIYMGLVPEARGRHWGRQIARYAQWLARAAQVERIVLAVDVENAPALTTYRVTGFEAWDRRTVYVRFTR